MDNFTLLAEFNGNPTLSEYITAAHKIAAKLDMVIEVFIPTLNSNVKIRPAMTIIAILDALNILYGFKGDMVLKHSWDE